jgi:hypothetical protein
VPPAPSTPVRTLIRVPSPWVPVQGKETAGESFGATRFAEATPRDAVSITAN